MNTKGLLFSSLFSVGLPANQSKQVRKNWTLLRKANRPGNLGAVARVQDYP